MLHSQKTSFGGLTPQRVPEAYIRAEVIRMPLASEEAFYLAITELHPLLESGTGKGNTTRKLWRRCEELLSEHASGWSLDRLIAIRDYYWFNHKAESYVRGQSVIPLHRYLRTLACSQIYCRPGISELRDTENFFDSTIHYRWLTFALPEDLLLMSTEVDPSPTCVDIDPPLFIKCLLDRGVSEIHQHIGASMDFKTYWMSTLAALASPETTPDSLKDPEVPFKKSETFLRWLLAGVITRSLLMEYLLSGNKNKPFIDYVLELRQIRGQLWNTLEKALFALQYPDDNVLPNFYALRNLYQKIHPRGFELSDSPPETLEKAWSLCDPIAVRLSLKSPNAGEVQFVQKCLAFLERNEPKRNSDKMFESLFWQVIRLRNLLYRSVVQRPMTAGLQWFIRFSKRLSPLKKPLYKIRAEVSYEVACGSTTGPIAALEIRCMAADTSKELAEDLCQLMESWKTVLKKNSFNDVNKPEFGILLLFAKERDHDNRWEGGNPPAYGSGTHAEPLPRMGTVIHFEGKRYTNYFRSQVKKVKATAELLHRMPSVLWVLRGIDVASDELSIPTWVLVPLFRFLERESAFAAAGMQDTIKPAPLKVTAHVGEDFRHLMEGMRRIFETVHYLLPHSGGRLGHATALGYDPQQWAEQTGSVMMPVEDRLWDLVFEWRLYTRFETPYELRISEPPGRIGYLENQIRIMSNLVFAWGHEPKDIALVHHKLHTLWSGPEVNENQAEVAIDNFSLDLKALDPDFYYSDETVRELIEKYRTDEDVFRRGQRLVSFVIDESEIIALQAVQDALRGLVSIRDIVAEVNPSSNLLIGNLLDLRNHPTLRLFPPEPQEGGPPPINIAIGSDDPITFCTHLLREYTLLYNAALSAGYSEKAVDSWLEDIQCTGMNARFTLKWPRYKGQNMVDKLLEDFDYYLKRPAQYRRFRK